MIGYIRRKLEKNRIKKSFKEYGSTINTFQVDGLGAVSYAQWHHPLEQPKEISRASVDFYRKLATPGGLIIDIGAHTGDTTVPMALAVGKEGMVIALEPNGFVFKVLAQNAELNPTLTNIIALPYAATENDGEFEFNYSDASFCNGGFLSAIQNQKHHHPYKLTVQGRNLQRLLLEKYADRLPRLQLLKVDAEGYDKQILKALPEILRRYKPHLMVECYKRLTQKEREELWDVIDGYGYHLHYTDDFEADNFSNKIERAHMMRRKHFDMVCIPQN